MELIAIRHTQVSVARGICYGISDLLPATNFKADVLPVKKALLSLHPDKVYTSPLKRCSMLASECGFEDVSGDNRLMEMNFGKWEMASWHTIAGDYAEKWFADYVNVRCPGGESLRDMITRVEKFLEELKTKKYEQIICFTHSGPIRVMNHILKNLALENLFDIDIAFGGVYSFRVF